MLPIKLDLYHIYSLLMQKRKYLTTKLPIYVITFNVPVEVIMWDKLAERLQKEQKNINSFAMSKNSFWDMKSRPVFKLKQNQRNASIYTFLRWLLEGFSKFPDAFYQIFQ